MWTLRYLKYDKLDSKPESYFTSSSHSKFLSLSDPLQHMHIHMLEMIGDAGVSFLLFLSYVFSLAPLFFSLGLMFWGRDSFLPCVWIVFLRDG